MYGNATSTLWNDKVRNHVDRYSSHSSSPPHCLFGL